MLFSYIVKLFDGPLLSLFIAISVAVLATASWFKPSVLPSRVHEALSSVINIYLCWWYPIKDQTGSRPLPTCPYSWPNGQGNVGKFLEGIENREIWDREYGQIYRIWSGMKSEVVLTKAKHIQAVFSDSDKHIKAVNNNSGYIMGQLLGQCVGLVSGRKWQATRAVTEEPFVHSNVAQHIPMIRRHVEAYMKDLQSTQNLHTGFLHPANDLKFLPFWIVAEIFYGELPTHLRDWLQRLIPLREELFNHVIQGGTSRFAIMRFFPTDAGKKLADFQQQWSSFNRIAVQHARHMKPPAPIIQMYEAVNQGTILHEQLLQTIDESLFANLDVTIGALTWNPVFLAANPECQERLRTEVTSQTPETADRYIQSSTTYLAACILESSRLKPLAAFSVPQSAPTDRVVEGYLIPARTNFIVDAYALNVRNEFWGSNAEKYEPERFLRGKTMQLRYNYWRFGFGPRQCMGRPEKQARLQIEAFKQSVGRLTSLRNSTKTMAPPELWTAAMTAVTATVNGRSGLPDCLEPNPSRTLSIR
ncbi:MAG: hypothetical protein Q9177_004900 [Variospora cf. flavescens]